MFGGSLFDNSGGDVNAASMGGGQAYGGAPMVDSTNQGINNGGLGNVDSTNTPMSSDPAEQAAGASKAGLEKDDSGQGVAGMIGKTAGLFSSLYGIVDARAKRLQKRQRLFSRAQAAHQLASAQRNVAQYAQDSAIQEQRLNQSYSGRGIGESSIQQEGMQYFHDSAARTKEDLAQRVQLAQLNQNLVRSQISMSYAEKWLSFGNAVANLF